MKTLLMLITFSTLATSLCAQKIWLDELDLSAMQAGWGTPHARKSVEGNVLTIAGQKFDRGVGTHAVSTLLLILDGKGKRFTASVGVDDEAGSDKASVSFYVLGDRKIFWESGVMKKGQFPKKLDVDVRNITLLGLLVTDAG